jgi:hypothetical protein
MAAKKARRTRHILVSMDLFAICFGKPKPFHRLWLKWSAPLSLNLHIVSDCVDAWEQLAPDDSRFVYHDCSVDEYFMRVSQLLGTDSSTRLIEQYGHYCFGTLNGWTACGFRPILPKLFPGAVSTSLWGWLDYDVLLSARLRAHLDAEAADNPARSSFFIPQGIRWEQFKVFRSSSIDSHSDEFRYNFQTGAYKPTPPPLEAQFIYSNSRLEKGLFSPVLQNQIAVHWHFTGRMAGHADINTVDVQLDFCKQTLHEAESGRELLAFIADDESKQLSTEDVDQILASPNTLGVWRKSAT